MRKITTGGWFTLVVIVVGIFILITRSIQSDPPIEEVIQVVEIVEEVIVIEEPIVIMPNEGEISGDMIYSMAGGWVEIPPTLEDFTGAYDRHMYLLNETSGYVILDFPKQPTKSMGEYYANTEQLNNWMDKNLQSWVAPSNIEGGYLFVKIRSPLKVIDDKGTLQPVVIWTNLYNNGWRIYDRLKVDQAVNVSDTEWIFPLDNVVVKNSLGNDWLGLLDGQIMFMGAFVGSYDNGVEHITLTRY